MQERIRTKTRGRTCNFSKTNWANFWTILKIVTSSQELTEMYYKSNRKIYISMVCSKLVAWYLDIQYVWHCNHCTVVLHMTRCSIIVSFKNSALYTNVYGSYRLFLSLATLVLVHSRVMPIETFSPQLHRVVHSKCISVYTPLNTIHSCALRKVILSECTFCM